MSFVMIKSDNYLNSFRRFRNSLAPVLTVLGLTIKIQKIAPNSDQLMRMFPSPVYQLMVIMLELMKVVQIHRQFAVDDRRLLGFGLLLSVVI